MFVDVCTHSVRRKFNLESDYKKDLFPILVDKRNEIWPNGLKIPVISKRKDLQGYDKSALAGSTVPREGQPITILRVV